MANNEKVTVNLDAQKAIETLNALEKETAELIARKNSLINIQTKLEASAKTETKEYRNSAAMLKDVNKILKLTTSEYNDQIKKIDVTQLSYNQLNKLLPKLRGQFYAMNKSQDPDQWDRYSKKLQDAEKQLKVVSGRVQLVKEKMTWKESAINGMKNIVPGISAADLIAKAASKAMEFIAGAWDKAKSVQSEAAKASRVFGSELGYVEMQAEKVAARAGLTNKEFVAMATNTADLLVPMGFTRKASADMAVDMQKLTGALVEWSNGKFTAEDVSMRLTKAVMGETEGLKELGIGIRKDSDEYKNLVKEKEKGEGVTKAQAEALATLELVMAKSVDAQTEYKEGGSALMKMGRDLSRMWRSVTESVAVYIATSKEDRMLEQSRTVKALNTEMADQETKINNLLPRYDELKTKSKLSADEHEELNEIVKKIGDIVPSAINAWDAEGRAIGLNTAIVNGNITAKKALLRAQNKELIDDLGEELEDNLAKLAKQQKRVAAKEQKVESAKNAMDDISKYGVRNNVVVSTVYENESNALLEDRKNLNDLEKATYSCLSAQVELGLSFDQIGTKSKSSSTEIEKLYHSLDRKANPNFYKNDGTKKTNEELAKEEEERKRAAEAERKKNEAEETAKAKAKNAAEKAKEEAEREAEKEKERKEREAEKAKEDQKKLEQDIRDTAMALSGDELKIEQDRYDKKLQALKLYGVDKAALNAEQLAALEALEGEHQNNIDKIEDSAVASFLSKNDKQFNRELTDLKIQQAEEIAAFKGTKEEKEKLEKEHQEELKTLSAKGLEETIKSITMMLSGENLTGLSEMVLSDEQKAELDAKLADVKLKLAELKGGSGENEDTNEKDPFKIDGSSTDVLGMTPDTWGQLQENLENGKVGLGEMVAMAKALSAAFGMYNEMATANEKKQLADFEKQNEEKKDILKRRLESGVISQEEYNTQVASLDEEVDAKKHEMEVRQAKRDKVQALFDIAISTAIGIASALKTPLQSAWLIPMISAIGAIQVATVLATPLPGKEKGGFIVEREDGKTFDAEYAPYKRGYITKPTVITGENGSEYVIPADGMRNPSIASVVSMIENARIRGNIKDVNLQPTYKMQGREQGGHLTDNVISTQYKRNDDTAIILTRMATVLEKLEKGGVKASIPLMGDGGIVQQIDKVFKIQNRTTI